VGAPSFALFAKGGYHGQRVLQKKQDAGGSIVPALAKKRKDGAPIVSKRETEKNQMGGPPVLAGGKAVVKEALQCAANCGAKAAFDEYNHPSPHATAPHLYVQTVPTQTGGSGALPSAEPEN
jgi:hypothetical protein